MSPICLHAVARQSYIDQHFADFAELLAARARPDDIPQRFSIGGRSGWTFQTLATLNDLYHDEFEFSVGATCRPDAINLMHNDDFGSRVKPWRGLTVVCRADRPPVLGADYVIEQNAEAEAEGRLFMPYWPQPGLQPRERTGDELATVAYFGRMDSFPDELASDAFKARLAAHGITLRISTDNWTDYR
ncbi:MAG TPA: hypothetical protein VLC08_04265, partial [Chitinolyticbacter sp.]|nr:hypothetical protein [Chitinolyticbacter sp.]